MSPSGYIWSGVGSGVLGALVLMTAHGDDEMEDSLARLQAATGETPSPSGDTTADVIALLLFVAAAILILIGAVGAGVRAGQSRD